ncbi:MAG: hypothetical protein U0934_05505 [Pseudotabrizicola sp.]|uniref:hypothetical protein n=1 Tax=Pseudotabrizicola sp. TaxID=2939647 RepID=UPI0027179026|nr:hypothetical protein [Pseudotabrizicola sp.]MDO8883064.1 hypothetical protein [Pseudotabrizicola sp.]MDP2080667.1 hypothetical protein [Pseudotabrizicola sp.]MDZ7573396.1 hypothetical protein [Pseudotabrizicola sp.]
MSDPSIAEFNMRIARIENGRAKGRGFEAEGTLGRSFYTRSDPRYRRKFRLPVLRPVFLALVFGTALKAMFLFQLGAPAYDARVAGLLSGQGVDRVGGWLMQADPVTTALARQISLFARLDR